MKAKIGVSFLLLLALCMWFPLGASANSAEPPSFTVIVLNAPADLTLSLQIADDATVEPIVLRRETKAWETYYRFFYHSYPGGQTAAKGAALRVDCNGERFSCALPWDSFEAYNNIVTLDLGTRTVTSGQPALRLPALVAMRVGLTLSLEGIVFFLLGYRSKKSWIAFFLLNLCTQGALNALLTGPGIGSYWMFEFALIEILVFAVEAIFFARVLKEHSKRRAITFAFTANAASLLLGGALLSRLPF